VTHDSRQAAPLGSRMRPPKMAELVASEIRTRIVRGQLKDGDSLPSEPDLMATFGVSRPTLREAFRVLESERILSIRRGAKGGAQVREPSAEAAARIAGFVLQYQQATLGDVFEARLAIEPMAAGLCARHRTAEDLVVLEDALAHESAQVKLKDPDAYSLASTEFHRLVVQTCGNRTLALFRTIVAEIVEAHRKALQMQPASSRNRLVAMQRSHKSHVRLMSLIEAQDADGAETYWREHLHAAKPFFDAQGGKSVLEIFNELDRWSVESHETS
jgi:DNA-binding FadR family transcriptional regulator